ncbi:hypothetical protein [Rhizobium sp. 18065]|uniref:hypothetical protein n=1 Tax=Rhizobium sp. 18065 TaxID=2681411 RepID=UPI00135C1FBF|nr:hypothetical protein [Rhizobium sp. 18065]
MARMIDIDEFLPEVMRYAPNASDFVAQRFLLQAARDLCDRLKIWRENDTFEVTDSTNEGVCTIRDADIVSIDAARLNGVSLEPQTNSWLDENQPGWSLADAPVAPARYITQLEPNTVTVVPKATGTMTVRLVLKPARDATSMPAFLLDEYSEEIGRGAAGRILTDPNSDNPQLGLDHRQWFKDRLDSLSFKAVMGQHRARPRAKGSYL